MLSVFPDHSLCGANYRQVDLRAGVWLPSRKSSSPGEARANGVE
jgi:hypothetical protein